MRAEKLRKQFQKECPKDDLFTVFHVKWLEQKLINQQAHIDKIIQVALFGKEES